MTEKPESMVDKVALAIWRAREETYDPRLRRMEPDGIDMSSGAFGIVRTLARAALEALKEPTTAMVEAGAPIWKDGGDRLDLTHLYQAMINTALEEKG